MQLVLTIAKSGASYRKRVLAGPGVIVDVPRSSIWSEGWVKDAHCLAPPRGGMTRGEFRLTREAGSLEHIVGTVCSPTASCSSATISGELPSGPRGGEEVHKSGARRRQF